MGLNRLPVAALVAAVVVAAVGCQAPAGDALGHLSGVALAGPTCPVVTDPPQSGCEDRPVAGATLLVVSQEGEELARVTTGDDGRFTLDLSPGVYEVRPQPVDGIMGTAPPATVSVASDAAAEVTISYDTGIR
jgi:hypothetical protein